jgi:hypothetical protein
VPRVATSRTRSAPSIPRSASRAQLLFTNAAVASALLGAFYAWRQGVLAYEEAYIDVLAGRQLPVQRKLQAR